VAFLYTLYAFSIPSPFNGWYVSMLLWAATALAWLALVVRTLWRSRPLRVRAATPWLPAPLLLALAITLVAVDAPFQAPFRLSRGAMDATARRVIRDPAAGEHIHRIGLFEVWQVERVPGGMRFFIKDSGFVDFGGLAYSPNGAPRGPDIAGYEHLDGPWWVWWFDF
jgi:hypothetical protein